MVFKFLCLNLLILTINCGDISNVVPRNYEIRPVENWPDANISLGQVSAIEVDNDGNVVVFHRGLHVWDQDSFSKNETYLQFNSGPINVDTVIVIDNSTGNVVRTWGKDQFYMPHGLTVDFESNVWLTDVALHQIFKYDPKGEKALLTMGVKYEPGSDNYHFCKPTSVAVLHTSGDFFVADGYCNSRIIKYSRTGTRLLQFGSNEKNAKLSFSHYSLLVPHALALIGDSKEVCVADREHGRIVCYNYLNGSFSTEYSFPNEMGPRLFSLSYSPKLGGRLFVVNGPAYYYKNDIRGFVINIPKNTLEATFVPSYGEFSNPHDIVVTELGNAVYVAELNPMKIHKFEIRYFNDETVSSTKEALKMQRSPITSNSKNSHNRRYYSLILLLIFVVCCIPLFVYLIKRSISGKKYRPMVNEDNDESVVFYSK